MHEELPGASPLISWSAVIPRFKKLRDRMTQVRDEKRGSFRATADTLSDKEAHDWIVEFYNISVEVEEAVTSHAENHYGVVSHAI